MNENDEFLPEYFRYNPLDNTLKIWIAEYKYDKEEFNLDTELSECIREINRLYNKCDDDRITYDTQANDEFYLREAIQDIPRDKLRTLTWRLEANIDPDEKLKVEHQIEILKEVVEEIDRILS